ncbi:hypothetical protein HH212_21410 [Massilia forsythiae]|uniref:Sel1 repeat family protein n=1 Tax=Massilia forsythiae TaxID=2728020 RepID=A0A7Z2ZVL9_9BURK|nr:hypothetical protein [Massilia forsythiae]QJE02262.1 hypothetical protein HH212_21410 [Massilia forsythiae]
MAAIVAGGLAWKQRPDTLPAPLVKAALAPLPPRPALPAAAQAAPMPAIALPAAEDGVPVGVQVERLLARNDPQQAYAAYLLVSGCAMFNARRDIAIHDDKLHAPRAMNARERQSFAAMCGEMTERQRLARLDHLALAVKGGVPGAAVAFASEGPFGDPSALKTRPDDPLVREWKAQASALLDQATQTGDQAALAAWGIQNMFGSELREPDPVLGYGYWLALGLISADRSRPGDAGATAYADGGELMNAVSTDLKLTREQRAAALAAARRIADSAKTRQQGQGAGTASIPTANPFQAEPSTPRAMP